MKELKFDNRPVLTVTVLEENIDEILALSRKAFNLGADCVEIRVDKIKSNKEVEELITEADFPHIISCRSTEVNGYFKDSEEERIKRQLIAINAGANIIDIELTTEEKLRQKVIKEAKNRGTPLLIGYEDMNKMPSGVKILKSLIKIEELGADIAKFAVKTESYEQMLEVLKITTLAKELINIPFAAIAIGEKGLISRPIACLLGASMTYCALEDNSQLKQLSIKQVEQVYDILSQAVHW